MTEDLEKSDSKGETEPGFREAESQMQKTRSLFEDQDYIAAIELATEAMDTGSKAFFAFSGDVLSYAIRSSESIISNMKDLDVDTSEAEDILNEAKESAENKDFENAGSTIRGLKEAIEELQKQCSQKVTDLVDSTQSQIDKAKGIGSDVSKAEEKQDAAREMVAAGSIANALVIIKEAESLAKAAYDEKIKDVSSIISIAEKAIEEAKYINAPVSEAEDLLEDAKSALNSEDHEDAIEKANRAIKIANDAKTEQIQRALSLQQQMAGVSTVAAAPQAPVSEEPAEEAKAEEAFKAEEEKAEEAEELVEKEVAFVCPKCGKEPTYVEQYKKHYCYTCNTYVEPVEKGKEEKKEEVKEEAAKVCPKCGGEPTYVEQYKKYYCYVCNAYVEPAEKKKEPKKIILKEKVAKVCPKCGVEPTYVEQYKKHYCYTCNAYVEPVEKGKEKKAEEKKEPTKTCPKCGREPTYVDQYQKYYCYNCNSYVEPKDKTAETKPKETICPSCRGKPTYVEQYDRYYCYTCNKYV